MLRTFFSPKSISNKCSTVVAGITSNAATVGEVRRSVSNRRTRFGRSSGPCHHDRKGQARQVFRKLGDEKA